jgi:integrase
MATIRKRGKGYQIDYFDPIGKRIRKSFVKKKDAEAELGKRVSLKAEGRYLDVKKECKTTLGELLKKYRENYQDQKSFQGSKEYCLENFKEYFGENTLLSKIRFVNLETYKNHLKKKPTWRGHVRKDASVNREIACLHHIFTKAVQWEMIEKTPFEHGKSLLIKENNKRLRYLTQEEIKSLLDASPEHLRNLISCSILTGMRKSETLNLKWSQIRDGLIYLDKTKTNEPRQVPICDILESILIDIKQKQDPGTEYVFLYDPTRGAQKKKCDKVVSLIVNNDKHPVKDIKTAFSKALTKAGINDFRWHDLRHTAASHLVMNGAGLKDVQEILGHKTMSMTMRYAHLSQEHKKKAVNLLNGITSFDTLSQTVTNPPQTTKKESAKSANSLI